MLDEQVCCAQTEEIIRATAATSGCLVLGRAAACVLNNEAWALHVRLDRPRNVPDRPSPFTGAHPATAAKQLEDTDRARQLYVRQAMQLTAGWSVHTRTPGHVSPPIGTGGYAISASPPVQISASQIDPMMDQGKLLFVVEIPPNFEADIRAQRKTGVQINVDATAVAQAGNGSNYLKTAIANEIQAFISGKDASKAAPINLVVRAAFNPNLKTACPYRRFRAPKLSPRSIARTQCWYRLAASPDGPGRS